MPVTLLRITVRSPSHPAGLLLPLPTSYDNLLRLISSSSPSSSSSSSSLSLFVNRGLVTASTYFLLRDGDVVDVIEIPRSALPPSTPRSAPSPLSPPPSASTAASHKSLPSPGAATLAHGPRVHSTPSSGPPPSQQRAAEEERKSQMVSSPDSVRVHVRESSGEEERPRVGRPPRQEIVLTDEEEVAATHATAVAEQKGQRRHSRGRKEGRRGDYEEPLIVWNGPCAPVCLCSVLDVGV